MPSSALLGLAPLFGHASRRPLPHAPHGRRVQEAVRRREGKAAACGNSRSARGFPPLTCSDRGRGRIGFPPPPVSNILCAKFEKIIDQFCLYIFEENDQMFSLPHLHVRICWLQISSVLKKYPDDLNFRRFRERGRLPRPTSQHVAISCVLLTTSHALWSLPYTVNFRGGGAVCVGGVSENSLHANLGGTLRVLPLLNGGIPLLCLSRCQWDPTPPTKWYCNEVNFHSPNNLQAFYHFFCFETVPANSWWQRGGGDKVGAGSSVVAPSSSSSSSILVVAVPIRAFPQAKCTPPRRGGGEGSNPAASREPT